MPVTSLHRSLEQELFALLRGASLECPACGEFVLHLPQGGIFCPECGSGLDVSPAVAGAGSDAVSRLQFPTQAG